MSDRPADPAAANTATRAASEFGSGIVVCLAKEHLLDALYEEAKSDG